MPVQLLFQWIKAEEDFCSIFVPTDEFVQTEVFSYDSLKADMKTLAALKHLNVLCVSLLPDLFFIKASSRSPCPILSLGSSLCFSSLSEVLVEINL